LKSIPAVFKNGNSVFSVNSDAGTLNQFSVVLTPYLVAERTFVSEPALSKPFYVGR